MEDNENGRYFEVRSLTGESVQDLKQCFAPAISIFSGEKLILQSQISSYSIGDEDFLVTIPFLKKDRLQGADAELSENPSASESLETESVNSAWVELMEDLPSLRDASNLDSPPEAETESDNFVNRYLLFLFLGDPGSEKKSL